MNIIYSKIWVSNRVHRTWLSPKICIQDDFVYTGGGFNLKSGFTKMLRTPEGSPEEADVGKDAGPVGLAAGDRPPRDDSGQVHRAVLHGPGYVTGSFKTCHGALERKPKGCKLLIYDARDSKNRSFVSANLDE